MDRRSSAPSSRRRKESLLVAEGLVWKNRGGVAMRGRQIGQRNFFNLSDPAQVWWRCPLPASGRHATTVAALAALSPDTMTHPLRLRPLPLQMLGRRRCLLGWRQLSDSRTAGNKIFGSLCFSRMLRWCWSDLCLHDLLVDGLGMIVAHQGIAAGHQVNFSSSSFVELQAEVERQQINQCHPSS